MKQLISTENYELYLKKQWKDIERLYELKLFSKHVDIISQLPVTDEFKRKAEVLCVGARYGTEVEVFKQMGFVNIKAFDIYPRYENVIEADMHNLPFAENSFDIIYSHHSLDHSLFPKKAVSEMYRVSRNSAYWVHSIPFDDFGKEEAIDFDNPDEVIDFFKEYTGKILYSQVVSRTKKGYVKPAGFCLPKDWKSELRLVLSINKKDI